MATFYRTPWKSNPSGDSASHSGPRRFGGDRPYRSTGPAKFSRPQFGNRRPSGGGSFGNRGGYSRGGSRGPQGERIDVSRFINKAAPVEEKVVFVPTHQFKDFKL